MRKKIILIFSIFVIVLALILFSHNRTTVHVEELQPTNLSSRDKNSSNTFDINKFLDQRFIGRDNIGDLTLLFTRKDNNTINVNYFYIDKTGEYMNGYDVNELEDNAGSFNLNEIKGNKILVKLKSYRADDIYYNVEITFNPKEDNIRWNILEEYRADLPKDLVLKKD